MKDLSIDANISWQLAAREAAAAKCQFIEKEHVFIGIFSLEKVLSLGQEGSELSPQDFSALQKEQDGLQTVMKKLNLDMTQLRRRMRKILGTGNYQHTEKVTHRSEKCKGMFARAYELAASSETVSVFHLLDAIMEEPGDYILKALALDENGPNEMRRELHGVLTRHGAKSATPLLDRFGRDLTAAAREGGLGPFIGRRNELLQVIQTLARSMKNNPVLVGEPGVGKTAVVEALAVRSVKGKNPQVLGNKRIVELNMGTLVGGTKYRGEFEERLTKIIQEARSNPEIIVFIDEIHTVVGAGAAGGGDMDAADLMKPALARGEIRCIGATTIAEYRKYIESDPALERRFDKIIVNEPTRDETVEILKGLKSKWELHFSRKITDKALEAAVDLSMKFDKDRFLPDKAIDIVDKAGARMQIPFLSIGPDTKGKGLDQANPEEVTQHTIADVLSEKLGLPLEILTGHLEGEKGSRLLELNAYLKKRVIGQDEAVDRVSQRLLMAHTGIGKREGPLAVLLFLGPTGVGKTELAKALAEFLFGSSNLIRLDMSEYMEEHSVAKLIGSPPGYVGHDEEGLLTGKLRTKPYAVVLLDEVEKAHPRIFDLFLQVFDEGRITDAKGRAVDAKNAIFIMTSNLYQKEQRQKKIGFVEEKGEGTKKEARAAVAHFFRSEFLNRIDEQIVFRSLGNEDVLVILDGLLAEIIEDLKLRYSVTLKVSDEAKSFITREGYDPKFGVRELRRTVERLVQIPLSNLILRGKLNEEKNWEVVCKANYIAIVSIDEEI